MTVKQKLVAASACVAFCLSACMQGTASGQVVAVANGEEVTIGELQSEAAARSTDAAGTYSQSELLRDIVDRKLWAQDARRNGLDKQIDFVLSRRRLEDGLLANMRVQAVLRTIKPPSQAQIDQYIAANPAAFASRTMFDIEQITMRPGPDAAVAAELGKMPSLDAVDARLAGFGIVGQRSHSEWNSMFMPARTADRLRQLPAGAVFLQRDGETLIAATVKAIREVPVDLLARQILVRQSLAQQQTRAAIGRQIGALRAAAKIYVQPGYKLADPAQ